MKQGIQTTRRTLVIIYCLLFCIPYDRCTSQEPIFGIIIKTIL